MTDMRVVRAYNNNTIDTYHWVQLKYLYNKDRKLCSIFYFSCKAINAHPKEAPCQYCGRERVFTGEFVQSLLIYKK